MAEQAASDELTGDVIEMSGQKLHGSSLNVAQTEFSGRRHRPVQEVACPLGVSRRAAGEEHPCPFEAGPGQPDGRAEAGTLGAGEVFGEMSLLTNEARSATVRCETDGELLRVGGPHMRALLGRDASAASAVAAALSGYVRTQNLAPAGAPQDKRSSESAQTG